MIATCNGCGYKVPWDEIGLALMAEHLKECPRRRNAPLNTTELPASQAWFDDRRP